MIDRRVSLPVAGCVFFGALVLLELGASSTPPVPPPAGSPKVDSAPATVSASRPDPQQGVSVILARPLFSPTRRPPPTSQSENSNNVELGGARLTGIVITPNARLAIFDIKGAKAVVLNEGETMSGWRVDSIAPGEVSLLGPGGSKTLQPKLDTSHTVSSNTGAPGQPPPPSDAPRSRSPNRGSQY